MKPAHPYYLVGRFFFWKYRALATTRGVAYATARMRRDGVPRPLHDVILTPEGYMPPPKALPPPRRTWFERLVDLFTPTTERPRP